MTWPSPLASSLPSIVGALALLGGIMGIGLWLRSRSRRARIKLLTRVEVAFDLELPSQWAAELTGRVLLNEGIRSKLVREEGRALCRVEQAFPYSPQKIQSICKRLAVIAEARGGGCRSHTIRAGKKVVIFEH